MDANNVKSFQPNSEITIDLKSRNKSVVSSIENRPIHNFYENKTILISGGTGFLGKTLVYKLLTSFKIKKIYLLIREKNGIDIETRLQEFFQAPIFNKIRDQNAEIISKVHPIYVNFNVVDLDITTQMKDILKDEVQIVFNVVASVKFNEKFRDAILVNILGTKKILDLVMEMKNLKAFLHVSTLFSNCNRQFIEEKVYETEIGYEKIIQLSRILTDEDLENLQHCLLKTMPNTYTMTKQLSECLVNHRAFHLPAGIFRPPIVLSVYKEPLPGWTDNLYGPAALCTWSARGFIHVFHGNSKKIANLIPVDYCVNAMISCAWDIGERFQVRKCSNIEIPVYNYNFSKNNLTWGQYMHLSRLGFHEPFDKALWYFSYVIVRTKFLHRLTTFLLHNIPGYILDLIAMATGQKKIYTKGYKKIAQVIEMMSYFGLREWKFTNENIVGLSSRLVGKDKDDFCFNTETIDWDKYFGSYLKGIRKYIFHENDKKLEQKKKAYRRLYILHLILKLIYGFTILRITSNIFFKLICFIVEYFYKI